jgi:raffinose/stachyose/melibiose transport system substrate-binding protein
MAQLSGVAAPRKAFGRRRWVAPLTALPVAALALTACAAGGSGTGSTATETGPVTIRFAIQTQSGAQKPYSHIVEEFHKANPNITVKIEESPNEQIGQVLKTQFQAGNAPDVVYGSPGTGNPNALGNYSEGGYLLDLSKDDWATKVIPESAKALYVLKDQQIGIPFDVAPISEIISTAAYKQVGIEPAKSFDQVIQQCATARQKGKASLFALSGSTPPNTGIMAMELAATRVYAKDPEWNAKRAEGKVKFADSDGWKQTLNDLLVMNKSKCFQDGASGGTFDTLFQNVGSGTSLGFFGPAGSIADLKAISKKETFDLAAFPGATESDQFIFASPTNAVGINKASKHIAAAKTFLQFIAQPTTQDAFAKLSGNVSLNTVLNGAEPDAAFKSIADLLKDKSKNAPLGNLAWPNGEVYNALGTGVQGLFTGQASVDDVLKGMDDAWGQ